MICSTLIINRNTNTQYLIKLVLKSYSQTFHYVVLSHFTLSTALVVCMCSFKSFNSYTYIRATEIVTIICCYFVNGYKLLLNYNVISNNHYCDD